MAKDPIYFFRTSIRYIFYFFSFAQSILWTILAYSLYYLFSLQMNGAWVTKFSLIFSLFLYLGIGGYLGELVFKHRPNKVNLITIFNSFIGIYGIILLICHPLLIKTANSIFTVFNHNAIISNFLSAIFISLIIAIPFLSLGILLAVFQQLLEQSISDDFHHFSLFFFYLCIGVIIGLLTAGFTFFPVIGIKQTLFISSLFLLFSGLLIKILFQNIERKIWQLKIW